MNRKKIGKIAAMFVLTPVAFAVVSGIVMLLWNTLLPDILKLPMIGFWQAAGLLVLSRLLFGRRGVRFEGWRHRLRERAEQMTPEQRAALRDGLMRRGGCGRAAADDVQR
jgi:hypothetical protein